MNGAYKNRSKLRYSPKEAVLPNPSLISMNM